MAIVLLCHEAAVVINLPLVLVVICRGLEENLQYNSSNFFAKKAWLHIPVILAWFILPLTFTIVFYRRNGLKLDALFYASFSPLLLSIVAIDYYRWIALTSINFLLVILIHCRAISTMRSVDVRLDRNTCMLLASCLLGPISNTKSFPYFFLLLEKVSPWSFAW